MKGSEDKKSSIVAAPSIKKDPPNAEQNSNALKLPKRVKNAIPYAITPDALCEVLNDTFPEYPIKYKKHHKLGPTGEHLEIGKRIDGILVNGPHFIPQFIPNPRYTVGSDSKPVDWPVYDQGTLVKNIRNQVRFFPKSVYTFDEVGTPEMSVVILEDMKREASLQVLAVFKQHLKKKERRKTALWYGLGFVLFIIVLLSLLIAFKVIPLSGSSNSSSSSSSDVELANTNTTARSGTETTIKTTTATSTTTTTRAYPSMTTVERSLIKHLPTQTFEIVSAVFELNLASTNPILVYSSPKITYVLNMTQTTQQIQLHCAALAIGDILLDNTIATDNRYDQELQLLTVNLSKPTSGRTVTLKVSFTPSHEAFERIAFPSDSKEISVFVNKKLSLLVPHFGYSTKHKWTMKSSHPDIVKVVTNTKLVNNSSSDFLETMPMLPNELSIVIMDNVDAGLTQQTVRYYASDSDDVDSEELSVTLSNALDSTTKPSISSRELFSIIVVPVIENYQFYGRNIALVGPGLCKANQEIQNEFVWRFIFRTIIYNKVSSNDKNPTWIYEQSAFFLSTMIKSNNKNMWKKHLYGSAMDSGHRDIKGLSDQSMTYEDEHRYLDKYEHIAKVSTVLAMVTSLGSSVSGDPLTILDEVRDNSTSDLFFFVNKQLKLQSGQMLDVDGMTTCYVDSPVTPRVYISRVDPSHVLVQRTDGGEQSCDMYLCYVRDQNNKQTTTKECMLLSSKEQKVTVEAKSAILLSGDSPFSAYGYTMEQREFDRLVHEDVLASFDDSSLDMLGSNAFRAAFEGKLSYESLHSFMRVAVSRKVVSVDEAVDLWMWTVRESRNESLRGLTEPILASVLNTTDKSKLDAYVCGRVDEAVKQAPMFEIEKSLMLLKSYGSKCESLAIAIEQVYSAHGCITGTRICSYNPRLHEFFIIAKFFEEEFIYYGAYENMLGQCTGKRCHMPILRGLLSTKNKDNLQKWLAKTLTLDTDIINRQVVLAIFKGLATNSLSRHMLFPFLIDNWHVIHKKFSKFPTLIGDIIDTLASTIYTWEQLEELKQFVKYHGQPLDMYKEFQNQIFKAEKVVEWNKKYSDSFYRLFH